MSTDTDRIIELFAATPAFAAVSREALGELASACVGRALDAGESLFSAGDEFTGEVYVRHRGVIEVRRANGGVEHPPRGYFVGLSSFLSDAPYTSSATAGEATEVLVIEAGALRAIEKRYTLVFDALNRLIAAPLKARSVAPPAISGVLVKPVASVMSTPLATCPRDMKLRAAVASMQRSGLGSLAVVTDSGRMAGLLTYRGIAARLVQADIDPATETVSSATTQAPTLPLDAPLWRAQECLEDGHTKYVVITDADRAAGILSQTDLVALLSERHSGIAAAVGSASTIEELAARRATIVDVAAQALEHNRRARVAVRIVSEVHLAIQRRCVELTLAELEAQGAGEAPVPYALIIMGSGGRKEMMLDPDQDNGIILGDIDAARHEHVLAWSTRLCECLNRNLDRVGYVLCPGNIMARNPMFHKPLSAWRDQVARMCRRPSEKAARWSNIVFDLDTLFGEETLVHTLREHLCAELQQRGQLLRFMVEDDAQGRAPINLFNRLIATGKRDGMDTVDVKRNGLRIVADAARIFALANGIGTCNTSDRINTLVRRGVLSEDFGAIIFSAYDELLDILLMHQIEQRRAGRPLDKEVAPEELTPPARESLRVAMRAIDRFQERLQDELGRALF